MLHRFTSPIEGILIPQTFTNPFDYEPHPLCKLAAHEVMEYLQAQADWQEELGMGKMFGVLVVSLPETDELAYLAAFSGLLRGQSIIPHFVPPVYDTQQPDGFFKKEEREISLINARIKQLQSNGDKYQAVIAQLRKERKQRSIALQQKLFQHFIFKNYKGEEKGVIDIFQEAIHKMPPSGSGECAAPKLLQQAYLHHWQPVAMAEFWYGRSPVAVRREHGQFYPACQHKCRPILSFMLQGLHVTPAL